MQMVIVMESQQTFYGYVGNILIVLTTDQRGIARSNISTGDQCNKMFDYLKYL